METKAAEKLLLEVTGSLMVGIVSGAFVSETLGRGILFQMGYLAPLFVVVLLFYVLLEKVLKMSKGDGEEDEEPMIVYAS